MSGPDVEMPAVLDVGGEDARTVLAWYRSNPLMVRLDFGYELWEVGRDLLAAGCDRVVGGGDVRVQPGPGRDLVTIALTGWDSDEGCFETVAVVAPRRTLQYFLRCTYDLVPPGREIRPGQIDELITRILAGAS